MPLDFNQKTSEPTLGKARTKEEMKRRIKIVRKDVSDGLRKQGGFSEAVSDEESRRFSEYASILERQQKEMVAQFGLLSPGWEYVTSMEIKEVVEPPGSSINAFGLTNRTPQLFVSRDASTWSWEISLEADGRKMLHAVSETTHDGHFAEQLVYEINYLIRMMSVEMSRLNKAIYQFPWASQDPYMKRGHAYSMEGT